MTSGHITTSAGKVAYRQSQGTGPTIVLVHGNSASSKAFARQLDGTLGRTYRVIAYDLPGHGKSDDAADPAKTYTMPGYARVLREVAAQLGSDDAVFVGWSLGGHIVLEAAPDLPHAKGFAIFGTPPLAFPPAMEQAFLPTPAMAFTFAPELSEEQARAGRTLPPVSRPAASATKSRSSPVCVNRWRSCTVPGSSSSTAAISGR